MRTHTFLAVPLVLLFLLPFVSHARTIPNVGTIGSVLGASTQCPNLTRNLSFGSRGNDVAQLQQFLIDQGHLAQGNNTGYFGALTRAAVRKFQCKEMQICSGSEATNGYGVVGPKTRAKIASMCSTHTTEPPTNLPPPDSTPDPYTSPSGTVCTGESKQCPDGSYVGRIAPSCQFAACPASCMSLPSQTQTISCPAGQTGSITQTRTSSCPGPTWGEWVTTSDTCTTAVQSYPIMPPVSQTTLLNGDSRPDPLGNTPNIYSPEPVSWNGQTRLYFGGWNELHPDQSPPSNDWHDDIYVADCPYIGGSCSNVRKVIDAKPAYGESLNDPSIILHPATATSPAFYIMYMTCSSIDTNPTGSRPDLCYSVSYANDGINWSTPTRLLTNYWLPSAIWKNGRVELYAADHGNGDRIVRFDLGDGLVVGTPTPVTYDNPAAYPASYININIAWRPSLNAYQILAQRSIGGPDVIDYLDSVDGINWHLKYPGVISASSDQYVVITPAQHPDSAAWAYFGSAAARNGMGFKINFAQWNPPN